MRIWHRYLGFYLVGIMAVYAVSGMILIFRKTDTFKKEIQVQKSISKGLSETQLIPGTRVSDDWSIQLQQWQSAVHNLATEFIQGNSQLRVYNKTAFAYQNYLLPLNRWHEQEDITTQLRSSDGQLRRRN